MSKFNLKDFNRYRRDHPNTIGQPNGQKLNPILTFYIYSCLFIFGFLFTLFIFILFSADNFKEVLLFLSYILVIIILFGVLIRIGLHFLRKDPNFHMKKLFKKGAVALGISVFFVLSVQGLQKISSSIPDKYTGDWNIQIENDPETNKKGEFKINGLYKYLSDPNIYAKVVYTKWNDESGTERETEEKYIKIAKADKDFGEFSYRKKLSKNIKSVHYTIYTNNPSKIDDEDLRGIDIYVSNERYNLKKFVDARTQRQAEIVAEQEAERARISAERERIQQEINDNRFTKIASGIVTEYKIYMEAYTDLWITGTAAGDGLVLFRLEDMEGNQKVLSNHAVYDSDNIPFLLKGNNVDGYKHLYIIGDATISYKMSVR